MWNGFGELCALSAAAVWALAIMCFKRSGERISPVALNLFKNAVAIVLLAVTLPLTKGGLAALGGASAYDLAILAISGVIGISIADTLFFRGLNLCGVGLVSIVDCSYTPFTLFFSWLLLGEQLTPLQYAGVLLVLTGVLISTRHAPPPGRTRVQLLTGILMALSAMACMAFGIVMAKPVLTQWPTVPAAAVRIFAGTLVLVPFTLMLRERAEIWGVFVPSRAWRAAVPGSILGAYVSLLLWIAGFQYTQAAAVAAVLNQTSTVFALLLATLVLREPLGGRKLAAVSLALSGVLTVTLHEWLSAGLSRLWG
ncbi:MAG: DMT family transporter [Phycisphaerae bacterium]|nr:DMT family transporter [Phycisphaerae bacterium]MCZ2401309.1 DMT family transporter [Phycisphaerae bacterium]NUQ50898.1 DMT family transporter [Phycisphaerae bacterium]